MAVGRSYFIVLVGPDGVGKTSIAERIVEVSGARYFHYRPPLNPNGWYKPEPGGIVVGEIKTTSGIGSILRVARSFFVFWLGYLRSVRPEVKRGVLVIGDRWAYPYLAKPESVRYSGPRWLARALLRTLPQPDLIVALKADPSVIVGRKPELSRMEAEQETERWSSLPFSQLVVVDASREVPETAGEVLKLAGWRN